MQLHSIFDSSIYQEMIKPIPDDNGNTIIYIPLIFWFNIYNSLALPCISLKYHEIVLNITFNELNNFVKFNPDNINDHNLIKLTNCYILTEYISLTHRDKIRYTTNQLEYLILQTQILKQEFNTLQPIISMDINFFHPCKELYWFLLVKNPDGTFNENYFIPNTEIVPIIKSQIILNNEIIGSDNSTSYYSIIQPYEKHSRVSLNGINMYSFSLEPEEYQPSGSLNLSYIPHKSIQVTLAPELYNSNYTIELCIYCTNYNILHVANGFARLMYE